MATELNERDSIIDNVAQVKKLAEGRFFQQFREKSSLADETKAVLGEKMVRNVLREELGMRYRKIKDVAVFSNGEKNLILRQRWALEFLSLSKHKKVFLNIDETWLGMSDFRRRKWMIPGTTNSVPKLPIAPRITMIVGIDTLGNVYYSLAQANSNSSMMELFFRELAAKLDGERPGWRSSMIILVDGAPYHQSDDFLLVAAKLKLPYMILGPHSYDAAPCELFFAHLKKADINPRHLPSGRKSFSTVAELVRARIEEIPRSHVILYWHHCL